MMNNHQQRINFDADECPSSPEKMATEEMSFYASGNSPAASPRPCSISPICMEMSMLSPETSPCRFNTASTTTTITEDGDHLQILRRRQLITVIDDYESNSMDSGYSTSFGMEGLAHLQNSRLTSTQTDSTTTTSKSVFKFVEPCGTAPRRLEPSPPRASTTIITPPKSSFRLFNSLSSGSMESMDDDYLELLEIESLDNDNLNNHQNGGGAGCGIGQVCDELPANLTNLISGNIMATRTTPENKRPLVRRCLSLNETESMGVRQHLSMVMVSPRTPDAVLKTINENLTPYSSRVGCDAMKGRCFKRPEPPTEIPVQTKRYRMENSPNYGAEQDKENVAAAVRRPALVKSISMNDAVIMSALAKCKFSKFGKIFWVFLFWKISDSLFLNFFSVRK